MWTPAATAPVAPAEPAATAAASPGSWSVVSESKESAAVAGEQPKKKGKDKKGGTASSWSLASGDVPGMDDADVVKAPSQFVALAQYAVLVVGLVMVLIGVFVMIGNSHVT